MLAYIQKGQSEIYEEYPDLSSVAVGIISLLGPIALLLSFRKSIMKKQFYGFRWK